MTTHEIHIWHERGPFTTTSRFYFTEELTTSVYRGRILRELKKLPGIHDDLALRAYKNYITVQWGYDDVEPYGSNSHKSAQEFVEMTTVMLITNALQWDGSVLKRISGAAQVQKTADQLSSELRKKLDWSKGQFPL